MHPIHAYGSEEQRMKYLPKLATANGSAASASPSRTRLRSRRHAHARTKVDGGYRLSGSKMWITNSPIADVSSSGRSRTRMTARSGLHPRKGNEGPQRAQDRQKLSLRASITGEIVMDGVEVPEENLLPNVSGLKGPFGCLNRARYGIGWGAMGAAEACFHARAATR
jgi:glutaryl-CoA dehydrogenase